MGAYVHTTSYQGWGEGGGELKSSQSSDVRPSVHIVLSGLYRRSWGKTSIILPTREAHANCVALYPPCFTQRLLLASLVGLGVEGSLQGGVSASACHDFIPQLQYIDIRKLVLRVIMGHTVHSRTVTNYFLTKLNVPYTSDVSVKATVWYIPSGVVVCTVPHIGLHKIQSTVL